MKSLTWDYKNVDSWKDEYPKCGGQQQSPINLNEMIFDTGETLKLHRYNIQPIKMTISNSGRTLELTSEWDVSSGPPTVTAQGTKYQLQKIHFHWGQSDDSGSEHIYNDLKTPLEMHMVHYNSEFGDFDIKNGDAILEIGKYSDTLSKILVGNASKIQEPESAEVEIKPFPISDFFDENSFDYYISYNGSLTIPPCSEGVTWIVLIPPAKVSATQMEIFRSIKLNHEDDHNNRPVQPINNRMPGKIVKGKLMKTLIDDYTVWNYKNVDSLKDEYSKCDGQQQSPINLDDMIFDDKGETIKLQRYNIRPVKMTISNTGHTLELTPEWDVLSGPPTVMAQGIEYKLQSFHFHWGSSDDSGSEHTYNESKTPLEMHIVHYNPEFGDFNLGNGNAVLVIGILFEIGKYSNALWEILDNAYKVKEPESAGVEIEPFPISDFFDENSFDYYVSYTRSFRKPPCSEGVTWIVLIPSLEVLASQMKIFRSIKLNCDDDHNNCPPQTIDDRKPGKKGCLIYS